jgi:hypothetical protein
MRSEPRSGPFGHPFPTDSAVNGKIRQYGHLRWLYLRLPVDSS